jgi:hypothetical protein
VDEVYDKLKGRFAENPALAAAKEDEGILKNFGLSKFADFEDSDDEEDPDLMPEPGVFEGDPSKEKEEYKERLIEHFFGK